MELVLNKRGNHYTPKRGFPKAKLPKQVVVQVDVNRNEPCTTIWSTFTSPDAAVRLEEALKKTKVHGE